MTNPAESDGGVPATQPVGADIDAPAQTPASPLKGMFGISGTGDVSGFGGLVRPRPDLNSLARYVILEGWTTYR